MLNQCLIMQFRLRRCIQQQPMMQQMSTAARWSFELLATVSHIFLHLSYSRTILISAVKQLISLIALIVRLMFLLVICDAVHNVMDVTTMQYKFVLHGCMCTHVFMSLCTFTGEAENSPLCYRQHGYRFAPVT